MPWEQLIPGTGKGALLPPDTVSIYRSKVLGVSSIRSELGDFVDLLYEKETNRMALQPSDHTPLSYKVRRNNGKNSWVISLTKFLDFYNLQDAIGKHYRITRKDGLIVIDLNEPIGETRRRGSSKP